MAKQQPTQQVANSISNLATPQAADVERLLLGELLVEPQEIATVSDILTAEAFYTQQNADIYAQMLKLFDAGRTIDMAVIANEMRGKIKMSYIADLASGVLGMTDAVAHAKIIYEKFVARTMQMQFIEAINIINRNEDVVTAMQLVSQSIDNVTASIAGNSVKHISDLMSLAIQDAERRVTAKSNGESINISTGLMTYDNATGGWASGTLNIIAGRPAMGKTALLLKFARTAAEGDNQTLIFELEMSGVKLADRLLMSDANNISAHDYRSGKLSSKDFTELDKSLVKFGKMPLYIDESPIVNVRYIRAKSLIIKKKFGLKIIFIDYLQLLDMRCESRGRTREQEVSETTRALKLLAKELNVPIVLLSQLSRNVEERVDKVPVLSDLRDSGAIEQDADTVTFIYRPAYYGLTSYQTSDSREYDTANLGILSLAKQREGEVGKLRFWHSDDMTRISDDNRLPIGSVQESRRENSNHENNPF